MQTNLYDFLRRLQRDSSGQPGAITLTDEEKVWLHHFLEDPGTEIVLTATPTGELVDGEPVMAQNYRVAGEHEDIFSLLCEAALQNPTWALMLMGVARFLEIHVPTCLHCMQMHALPYPSWEFSPHLQTPTT